MRNEEGIIMFITQRIDEEPHLRSDNYVTGVTFSVTIMDSDPFFVESKSAWSFFNKTIQAVDLNQSDPHAVPR